MKVLFIGDIHGRSLWKDIIAHEQPDKVVFVGDYFDSFDIGAAEQIYNFRQIVLFQHETDIEVIMLIGNHDHHYLVTNENYSGYQGAQRWNIESTIRQNLDHMEIAHQIDHLIISHAGISPVWCDAVFEDGWEVETVVEQINELYKYKPQLFGFIGSNIYGDDVKAGPLWIRPRSLMKSNKKREIKPVAVQIYGHTHSEKIDIKHFKKSTGEKYLNIDALQNGWYVVYENNTLDIRQYGKS